MAPHLVYEPKYDGIRAIVSITPDARSTHVQFWSRLGNEKTRQFPEVAHALAAWGSTLSAPLVLDGEIVALDSSGRPAGFQRLQSRIHVALPGHAGQAPRLRPDEQPTALIAFDVLRDGDDDLRERPLRERRAHLEQLFAAHPPASTAIRLSEQVAADGRALYARAQAEGWEGLLVKHAASVYRDGRRSPEWQKLKLNKQDEFVVGGWTEPKGARTRFGSLILGRYDAAGALVHAGDVGTGFTGAELERLWKLLAPAETPERPFAVKPKTLGRPHWVTPTLVAQVRYTEVTDDGRLRHPAYLGLRDDKTIADLRRSGAAERPAENSTGTRRRTARSTGSTGGGTRGRVLTFKAAVGSSETKGVNKPTRASRHGTPRGKQGERTTQKIDAQEEGTQTADKQAARKATRAGGARALQAWTTVAAALTAQMDALQESKRNAPVRLPDGDSLDVTNLQKLFWPGPRYTKGDLLRYYARVAPCILPVVDDRPLVMKRFPNGVDGPSFYQHRAPEAFPAGVRVEEVPGADVPTMFIGGGLKTLLYMTQLASISQDPWFSKQGALEEADVVAIDLDPQPHTTFRQVQDVALWVHDELERLHVPSFPKTSGSEGLHIFIPLPPGTSYQTGVLFCQIVATLVAAKHPKMATVERMVKKRQDRTVYVDYLQNIPGKTLACAYSARASAFAGVSAPLTWAEVDDKVSPQDFTIATMPQRIAEVGDLWAKLRSARPADLARALAKLQG